MAVPFLYITLIIAPRYIFSIDSPLLYWKINKRSGGGDFQSLLWKHLSQFFVNIAVLFHAIAWLLRRMIARHFRILFRAAAIAQANG
jgi:hypothetical protein